MLLRASRLEASSRAKFILGLLLLPPLEVRWNGPAMGKSRPNSPQVFYCDSNVDCPAFESYPSFLLPWGAGGMPIRQSSDKG